MAKRNKIAAEVKAEVEARARAVAELRAEKIHEVRELLMDGIKTGSRKPLDAAMRVVDQLLHRNLDVGEDKDECDAEAEAEKKS